jgi:hypothetical protein
MTYRVEPRTHVEGGVVPTTVYDVLSDDSPEPICSCNSPANADLLAHLLGWRDMILDGMQRRA